MAVATAALVGMASVLLPSAPAEAQSVSFDRSEFGRIVLARKQSTGGRVDEELEVAIENYSNESVSKYADTTRFRVLGRSVGRLDVLTDAGTFPCTAFLVSDRHLVTNHHCVDGMVGRVKGVTRIEALNFVTGYFTEGLREGAASFSVSPRPVEADEALDYAVLEVFGSPSRDWGALKLVSADIKPGLPFWIIGHPMGEAQRISREGCASSSPALDGRARLRHTCDTLPGNSGSPVIDTDTGRVVALHNSGSKRNSINFAIPMRAILEHSRTLRDLAAGEVTAPTPRPPAPGPSDPSETASADCTQARADYDRAAGENTASAYRAHLDRFGTCPYAAVARDLLKASE